MYSLDIILDPCLAASKSPEFGRNQDTVTMTGVEFDELIPSSGTNTRLLKDKYRGEPNAVSDSLVFIGTKKTTLQVGSKSVPILSSHLYGSMFLFSNHDIL